MIKRILIADVETTGLSSTAEICELAFIEVDEFLNPISEFHSLIRPTVPIEPEASGASHITDAMVADAPPIQEVLVKFPEDFFSNVHLIAHNAPFDQRMLRPYWNITACLCTLRAARRYVKNVSNFKLQTLRYAFNLEVDVGAHRAMADVLTTHALLRLMLSSLGIPLAELFTEVAKPMDIDVMPFGKHKGVRLQDLPRGYVGWLLSNATEMDDDLKNSLRRLL